MRQAEEREKKEEEEVLFRARNDFQANLQLMKRRSEEKRCRWLKKHDGWKAWGPENNKYLQRSAVAREFSRELANEALREEQEAGIAKERQNKKVELPFIEALAQQERERKQEERETLEEPLSKPRDYIRGYGYHRGNYYGLTSEEAPFYGKDKKLEKRKS